ncbi:hypothetical protein H6P81_021321 [Aristolochia fimbriata]|uniref:Uncharacterized protein n=1 Tax=Aristolochia fimbriata TaxID=158543 RepID=A0AAV7DR86_ARIFI|nr:hypothetical protein H6P81_021321 [Aristolochia fimbriata]
MPAWALPPARPWDLGRPEALIMRGLPLPWRRALCGVGEGVLSSAGVARACLPRSSVQHEDPFCLLASRSASAFLGVSRVPSGLGAVVEPADLGPAPTPRPLLAPRATGTWGDFLARESRGLHWGTDRAGGRGGTNRCDMGLNLSGSWQQGHSATYNTRPPRRLRPPGVASPRHVPLGAGRPLTWVGKQAGEGGAGLAWILT